MKLRKWTSALFLLTGILILAGTAVLSFHSLNAPARLLGTGEAAKMVTEDWAEALNRGDYAAAGALMYGQPSLEPDRASAYEAGDILWRAFRESLKCSFPGEVYATESGIARDMTVTALDISAVMGSLEGKMDSLIASRAEEEDPDVVYDENNAYREEFVMSVLCEALEDALRRQDFSVQRTVTLKLVCEDRQWWLLPEQELIRILSGTLGKGD